MIFYSHIGASFICLTINERYRLSGVSVSYSRNSNPSLERASRKYSRISYFEYTTNEPGRRQSSEVDNPNRPILARHCADIRSHGTRIDWNIRTTAGVTNLCQLRARAQQGPTPRLELQLATASFAYRLHT